MILKYGIIFLILACFTEMFGVSSAQDNRCEQGWKSYGDSCYFRVTAPVKSWQGAQSECQKMQANLVTVNDDHEMKFLSEKVFGRFGSWCGLNYQKNRKQFVWVSGETSGYTFWDNKQPKLPKKRRCVHIMRGEHKWETSSCKSKFRYACEKAAGAPVKPCDSGPCQNGGTCIEEGNGYRCQCKQQFTGNNCETEIVPDPCDSSPCLNGGTCTSTGNVFSCSCTAMFTGDICETVVDPCDSQPCLNGGTCQSYGQDEYDCYCDYRYGGSRCETLLCSAYPCQNGGTCLEVDNEAVCRCTADYVGTFCEGVIPFIKQNPEDAVRMVGDDITLCCKAEGKPAPEIEWLKDNAPLNRDIYDSTLELTGLSSGDAGPYQCRARNKFGAAFSEKAELKIVPGSGEDSCNPTPLIKEEVLPPGCTEDSSGSDKVNVGSCSNEACVKRNQGSGGGCGGQNIPMCCSGTSLVDSHVTCGNGVGFNVKKIQRCSCAPCIQRTIFIHGKVVDASGNAVSKAEIKVEGVSKSFAADSKGYFTVDVAPGTRRLVMTVKDSRFLPNQHIETSKAFTIHEGQISFYTIVLQKMPPERKFQATEEQNIPLGEEDGRPSFVDLKIPSEAFIDKDGSIYRGEVTSNIGVIDPRSQSDLAAAPGDFSAVDENGEEIMLGTAGILRQAFYDANGKKLSLSKNITVRLDFDQLQIPDGVTVYQWYLSKQTGRWVKFGQLREESVSRRKRQARKFWVTDITADVPSDSINWDYVATVSYVRVLAPAGAVVTRIGREGSQLTSYRQETVPGSGLLCMRTIRDKPAYLQAELNGAPLFPVTPVGFPGAVNPSIIDGSSTGNPYGIRTISFTSTKVDDRGPVYLKGEDSRCSQNQAGDLAFQFQQASGSGLSFRWTSPRNSNWYPSPNRICLIKVVIGGSQPESIIYVKSTGKGGGANVDYGYTAEKATRVGNAGVVCLEYRCGEGTTATVQTQLQLNALTGNCGNIRVNSVLAGAQCFVSPDPDSQREENFCIPNDLSGGNAGLYTGDPGLALFRCEAGDNGYNQGQPTITANAPTVQLDCN